MQGLNLYQLGMPLREKSGEETWLGLVRARLGFGNLKLEELGLGLFFFLEFMTSYRVTDQKTLPTAPEKVSNQ